MKRFRYMVFLAINLFSTTALLAEEHAVINLDKEKLVATAKAAVSKKYPEATANDLQFRSLQYKLEPVFVVSDEPGLIPTTNMTERIEICLTVTSKTREEKGGSPPLVVVKRTSTMEMVVMTVAGEVIEIKGREQVSVGVGKRDTMKKASAQQTNAAYSSPAAGSNR